MRPSRLSFAGLLLLIAFTAVSAAHADNTGKRLLRILDALAGPEDSSATTQPRQSQSNRREEERKRALIAAIEPRMQAYYRAVAADDEAGIFAQYTWERVRGPQMVGTREQVLRDAAWVKQQIDLYGGLRRVRLLEVTEERYSLYEQEAKVIVELEFNNGKRDASARISVAQEGTATRAEQWKLVPSSVTAVGLFEIKAVAEAYHHALMVEQDVERAMSLVYEGDARSIRRYIERMQEQAEANNGLERIEVDGRLDNMRIYTHMNESLRGSGIDVTYHYRNGKNSKTPTSMSMRFIFDNGVWKVLSLL